jgi:hypothetical protein
MNRNGRATGSWVGQSRQSHLRRVDEQLSKVFIQFHLLKSLQALCELPVPTRFLSSGSMGGNNRRTTPNLNLSHVNVEKPAKQKNQKSKTQKNKALGFNIPHQLLLVFGKFQISNSMANDQTVGYHSHTHHRPTTSQGAQGLDVCILRSSYLVGAAWSFAYVSTQVSVPVGSPSWRPP